MATQTLERVFFVRDGMLASGGPQTELGKMRCLGDFKLNSPSQLVRPRGTKIMT